MFAWLRPGRRPQLIVADGDYYRFRDWPDDGELFCATGGRLVNLTTPGGDLTVSGDRILRADGSQCGLTSDLEPLRHP